jgi:putative ABC transport system permease protein
MFRNLMLIALRNFRKDKWFSLLNILGLTIGITFSLFLVFYIVDELGYDKYNEKHDRIYRINAHLQEPTRNFDVAATQQTLGPTIKKDFPEIEEMTRLFSRERTLFKQGQNSYYETKLYYADSTLFNVFTFRFAEGDARNALNKPNTVAMSTSTAKKYFGNAPAVGKTIKTVYDVYTVTAVFEDMPQNSHIRFDMLMSLTPSLQSMDAQFWGGFNNFTYLLLKSGTDAKAFEKKLVPYYDKYMAPIFAQFNVKAQYGLQPITDIHLKSNLQGEPEETGSMSYIWIFGAVAFFMLLIACINYMNLTTARSARRAKEIGIRKVTGSSKKQLVLQFLSESLLTSLVAVVLSVALIFLFMPAFNTISGKVFTVETLLRPFTVLFLLGIALFTGLVGGSYPAFYLSGFKPVGILKGALSKASGNINLRRTLVVIQFSISMIMLICTWVVYSQLNYVRKKDLGFDQDRVLTVTVNTGEDERGKIAAMNNDFRSLPNIKSVGTGYAYPGDPNLNLNLFSVETNKGNADKGIECYAIDESFTTTLGMKIVNGRNFSGPADTLHSILVNEAMVKNFKWDNAIGKRVKFTGDTSGNYLEVVGVLKDFNQKALYNPIAPLILFYGPNCNKIQLKIASGEMSPTIARTESIWKKYFPQLPFEYKFMDANFNSQYAADQKRGKIFAAFSILTIVITCLGLLGLTAFTTQQRQKEISVRRVLGASTAEVVTLITKNYLWLALIAAAVAFPVAWYFMNSWLEVFPYNAGLSFVPFIVSAMVILITALATAGFHSVKAAWSKPVNSLRTE